MERKSVRVIMAGPYRPTPWHHIGLSTRPLLGCLSSPEVWPKKHHLGTTWPSLLIFVEAVVIHEVGVGDLLGLPNT